MWALGTRGEPSEIKKNTRPKKITARFPGLGLDLGLGERGLGGAVGPAVEGKVVRVLAQLAYTGADRSCTRRSMANTVYGSVWFSARTPHAVQRS